MAMPERSVSGETGSDAAEGPRGSRCVDCGRAALLPQTVCASCGGPLQVETFSSQGTVWSATRVHVAVPGTRPPYGLAYVDLAEDGPRLLGVIRNDQRVGIGDSVRVRPDGDGWAIEVAAGEGCR